MQIVDIKTDNLSTAYLTLLNGSLKLTSKELDLLSSLLTNYLQFKKEGLIEPFLSKYVFSTEIKNKVQKELKITSAYFQNIISGLVKKSVVVPQGAGLYTFVPQIIPRKEIGFRFG